MFIRVSLAYIKGNPIKIISVQFHQECAKECLHINQCKSFNFDELKQICELFSINAETHKLIPGDCPSKDYYQRIGK